MAEKTDRRVIKTRKALKNALAELLKTKDLRNISIHELADKADVHRGTFYTHYQDIYDLYEQIEKEVLENLSLSLAFNPAHNYAENFSSIFDFIEEHKESFQVLYSTSTGTDFREHFASFMEEKMIEICIADEDFTREEMPEHWKYLINYSSCGFIALIERWVRDDFRYDKRNVIELSSTIDQLLDTLY